MTQKEWGLWGCFFLISVNCWSPISDPTKITKIRQIWQIAYFTSGFPETFPQKSCTSTDEQKKSIRSPRIFLRMKRLNAQDSCLHGYSIWQVHVGRLLFLSWLSSAAKHLGGKVGGLLSDLFVKVSQPWRINDPRNHPWLSASRSQPMVRVWLMGNDPKFTTVIFCCLPPAGA